MKRLIAQYTGVLMVSSLLWLTSSCDEENITKMCLDEYLEQSDMEPYTGQDLDCKFFLTLYEFQNSQYFLLGNHCADIISFPIDCDGNTLCENGEDRQCRRFYREAVNKGIVGVQKD
ncbi:MAG: hypothetical protein AAFX87_19070 [Bacteroidota bacterium]